MGDSQVQAVTRKGGSRLRRTVAAVVAASAVGLLGWPAPAPVEAGPAEGDISINCPETPPIPKEIPHWACPVLPGHFWGWWMLPKNVAALPSGYPTPPSQINPDGSYGRAGEDKLEATLQFLLALGQRSQSPYTPPPKWSRDAAAKQVTRVKAPTSGNPNGPVDGPTPLDFVKSALGAACPTDVYLTARSSYVLWAVGEDPETVIPGCNLLQKVRDARNPDGSIGPTVHSTAWGVFALKEVNGSLDEVPTNTADYLRSQMLPGGGWAKPGETVLDFRWTAHVIMALVPGLEQPWDDPVVDASINALAALQNDDAGFGHATTPEGIKISNTIDTAHVFAMLAGLVFMDNKANAYYKRFTKPDLAAKKWNPASTADSLAPKGGRLALMAVLGVSMQNWLRPEGTPPAYQGEGGFYANVVKGQPADPLETNSANYPSLPTSTATYYFYNWEPIQGISDEPVGPGGNPDTPTAAVAAAVSATPTVTG
jgi:hypothetical protein